MMRGGMLPGRSAVVLPSWGKRHQHAGHTGSDWRALLRSGMATGGAVMLALYWVRAHVLWFPIHPIGWAVSQMMLTRQIWFSVFLAWLVKSVLMRYGGPRLLRAVRPFFLGLILGQFGAVAFWLMVDWLAGEHGRNLYWV